MFEDLEVEDLEVEDLEVEDLVFKDLEVVAEVLEVERDFFFWEVVGGIGEEEVSFSMCELLRN